MMQRLVKVADIEMVGRDVGWVLPSPLLMPCSHFLYFSSTSSGIGFVPLDIPVKRLKLVRALMRIKPLCHCPSLLDMLEQDVESDSGNLNWDCSVSFLVQVLVLHFKFSDDEKQPIT
jgi:hypothetical protein